MAQLPERKLTLCVRAGNEMHSLGTFQRKCIALDLRDVDQELWPVPALVLLAIDIERATGDFSNEQIVMAKEQFAIGQAHRGAALTAAPRLHEDERAILGLQPRDQIACCVC